MRPWPCLNLEKKILSPFPRMSWRLYLHSSHPSQPVGPRTIPNHPRTGWLYLLHMPGGAFPHQNEWCGLLLEVLSLQGHIQRLRVDFMAAQGRDVGSEDGGAEGMQTWRDQVGDAALGNISFAFFLHPSEVWVGKKLLFCEENKPLFCGENKPLFCGENEPLFWGKNPFPGSQPPLPKQQSSLTWNTSCGTASAHSWDTGIWE